MTVEQFDPSTSNSVASQTTTLESPSKILKEQFVSQDVYAKNSRIGFISLGWPK